MNEFEQWWEEEQKKPPYTPKEIARSAWKASNDNKLLKLQLALQAAWPYVHQGCTIASVRKEIGDLLVNR